MPAVALTPKAGAHGELCGMMAIKAALEARGEKRSRRAGAGIGARHQSGDRRAARLSRSSRVPARADGTVDPEEVKKQLSTRRRRDHADQPEHLRAVRARRRRDRRGRARGRRLLLLRRRQLQRHRRQGAAGRSRRRRHAHQPAQDLLDAARRRRSGRRPGRALGRARAVRAGAVRRRRRRRRAARRARREAATAQAVRPHDRLPRPDGHVRARADLHAGARRRRHAAGVGGRGAQRQLHPRRPAAT